MSRHYNPGPYQAEARFPSDCAGCGKHIKKGDKIYIWPDNPKGKKAYCECAADDYRRYMEDTADNTYLSNVL